MKEYTMYLTQEELDVLVFTIGELHSGSNLLYDMYFSIIPYSLGFHDNFLTVSILDTPSIKWKPEKEN